RDGCDRGLRAGARGLRAGATRRSPGHHALRAASGPACRHRLLQPRRDPPARRGAGARLRRRGDPRRAPLLPAADDAARRGCDEPGELLPLHRARGDRPARRRAAQDTENSGLAVADDLYREVILDHYKNPRGHGVIEDADETAEGLNPLCGDEVSIFVQFADDGETVEEVKFSGRGCAISQASTSMLMEMVKG